MTSSVARYGWVPDLPDHRGRLFTAPMPGSEAFGYHDARAILETSIVGTIGMSAWTDSIFNASMTVHTQAGTLPNDARYHHYPKPIVDIEPLKRVTAVFVDIYSGRDLKAPLAEAVRQPPRSAKNVHDGCHGSLPYEPTFI